MERVIDVFGIVQARLWAARACACLALVALAGCVTSETRPLAKINPVQAQMQIPDAELLDVGVKLLDANIPQDIKDDEEALAKRYIYPEVRKAETGYIAGELRSTLETSGQWGAVRVVPDRAEFIDVLVTGRIVESTGKRLSIEVRAEDSMGRVWLDDRRYSGDADLGSYRTDASLAARDPFQNVYSTIANDLLAAREKLTSEDRRDIRRVTSLRFAQDLAPEAMQGYLAKDEKGILRATRLPADGDPIAARIASIRERDAAVIDTVNGYYANFADQMQDSYGNFRRVSYEEIEKEQRARASARTRTFLGAAAILASFFVPNQCSSTDYNCRDIQQGARVAGTVGGTAAILSGIKKYADAKVHAQALKELATTFQSEVAPQTVEVEGRTLKLTGSADEQYREWRELLRQLYLEESGGVNAAPSTVGAPMQTASPPASTNSEPTAAASTSASSTTATSTSAAPAD